MDARWKVMCLLFVSRVALGFQFQVVGSVTPTLVEQLQLDYRQAGILVGLFLFAGIFISFPAGLAQRYLSDRWLVVGGLLLLALGGFISGATSSYALIGFGRIVSGAGFVFSTIYFTKMVADWFSGKELATAMAILVSSWPIGIAIGQVLHPLLAQSGGFALAFQIASVYGLFGALLIWRFFRSPVATQTRPGNAAVVGGWGLSRYHLRLTVLAALVWALFNAVYVVYLSFVLDVLMAYGFDASQASALGSVPSWIMVFSAVACGQLVDRTGKRDLVLNGGLIISAVCLVLLSQGMAVTMNIVLLGTVGFGCAGVIMSLTGDAMPAESRAFGMGVFFTVYFLVGLPAPGIAGWLFDISANPAAPMIFASVLCLLAVLSNLCFRRSRASAASAV